MRVILTLLRVLGALSAAALAALFVLPMTVRVINLGNILGLAMSLWLFCACVTPIRRLFKKLKRHGFTRFLYRLVNGVFIVLWIYGIIISGFMFHAASAQVSDGASLITLGAQVKPSGEPSVILRGRINIAEEYLNAHPSAKAVLSGGKGQDEAISEAECMFSAMTADGISPDRLIVEDRSSTTEENFKFSFELMDKNDLGGDIAVATDGFHQLRANLIARQLGFKGKIGAVSSDTRWEFIATYTVREWIALPYQAVKGLLGGV